MLRRMVPSKMPCSEASSSLNSECVVLLGCTTSDFTSATLAKSEKIFKWSMKSQAFCWLPSISKVKILPAPLGK